MDDEGVFPVGDFGGSEVRVAQVDVGGVGIDPVGVGIVGDFGWVGING